MASEGSYADFSPHNPFQWELMGFLMRERAHVMKKEVLSGQGLENIHRFLVEKSGKPAEEWFLEESRGKPVSAVIIESGLSGRCEICSETLDRFVEILAAEAGNLAATLMATGGVYITGGVAPRFRERFEGPLFQRVFLERGVLTPVMEKIPVRLVTNPQIPLLGAAWYARNRM
jgi:glucokinase